MSLAEQIVLLANKLIVVQHVQLLARAQLFPTNTTRKAVQVEHLVPSFSHEVRWRQTLPTATAFRSVSPAGEEGKRLTWRKSINQRDVCSLSIMQHHSPIKVVSAI